MDKSVKKIPMVIESSDDEEDLVSKQIRQNQRNDVLYEQKLKQIGAKSEEVSNYEIILSSDEITDDGTIDSPVKKYNGVLREIGLKRRKLFPGGFNIEGEELEENEVGEENSDEEFMRDLIESAEQMEGEGYAQFQEEEKQKTYPGDETSSSSSEEEEEEEEYEESPPEDDILLLWNQIDNQDPIRKKHNILNDDNFFNNLKGDERINLANELTLIIIEQIRKSSSSKRLSRNSTFPDEPPSDKTGMRKSVFRNIYAFHKPPPPVPLEEDEEEDEKEADLRDCDEIIKPILDNEYPGMITRMLNPPIVVPAETLHLERLINYTRNFIHDEREIRSFPYREAIPQDNLPVRGKYIGYPIPFRIIPDYEGETGKFRYDWGKLAEKLNNMKIDKEYVKTWVDRVSPDITLNPECLELLCKKLQNQAVNFAQEKAAYIQGRCKDIFGKDWGYFFKLLLEHLTRYGIRGGYQFLETTYRIYEVILPLFPDSSLRDIVQFLTRRHLQDYIEAPRYIYREWREFTQRKKDVSTFEKFTDLLGEKNTDEKQSLRDKFIQERDSILLDDNKDTIWGKFSYVKNETQLKKDETKFDSLNGDQYYEFLLYVLQNRDDFTSGMTSETWTELSQYILVLLKTLLWVTEGYAARLSEGANTLVVNVVTRYTSFKVLQRSFGNFEYFMGRLIEISEDPELKQVLEKLLRYVQRWTRTKNDLFSDGYEQIFLALQDEDDEEILNFEIGRVEEVIDLTEEVNVEVIEERVNVDATREEEDTIDTVRYRKLKSRIKILKKLILNISNWWNIKKILEITPPPALEYCMKCHKERKKCSQKKL